MLLGLEELGKVMGYYIDQKDEDFFIDAHNIPNVIAAIHKLSESKSQYSWVSDKYREVKDIKELFKCWRWHVDQDDSGNIDSIYFEGQKLGDDDVLFRAIAPYVKDKSYIELHGEDNAIWRWAFKNGRFLETYPEITWNY